MITRRKALQFIVLLGIVSLFADITYEGARGITGPYLALLGASGATVGIVAGIGEFVGYGVRVLSGYFTDHTKSYWAITIIGYLINLLAVPLLAFAGSWEIAALLIILERFGKAIRTPPRDTMVSFATKLTGRGFGFGLHEALDKIGGVIGPLFIAGILLYHESYQIGFAWLSIPALVAIIFLSAAKFSFPLPQTMEEEKSQPVSNGLPKSFWVYVLAVGLIGAGFVDFALIAYHFQKTARVSPTWIPFFYAVSMGVAGLTALLVGKIFDAKGMIILAILVALASFFAPLVFFGSFTLALLGMILWGIGFGAQGSIMRATVALLVPPSKRGRAYGILYLAFGSLWAIGSAFMGYLYDISLPSLVTFSLICQLASVPILLTIHLKSGGQTRTF